MSGAREAGNLWRFHVDYYHRIILWNLPPFPNGTGSA